MPDNYLVDDLIALSGGLMDNANTQYLNLSKTVHNEDLVIVYTTQQINSPVNKQITFNYNPIINDACLTNIKEVLEDKISEKVDSDLININEASIEQLILIPGIGDSKAKAIISYRNITKFKNIKEIINVKGIGEVTFNKIKEIITI
jgi:competence protein ComEA